MSYRGVLENLCSKYDEDEHERTGLSPWARESQRSWTYAYWARGLKPLRASNKKTRRAREARMSRLMGLTYVPEDCPLCSEEDAAPPPSGVRPRSRPEAAPESERRPSTKPPLRLA